MGKILELENCRIQITKANIVTYLLSGVSPSVSASDIVGVGIGSTQSFIAVTLAITVSGSKTKQRIFEFTKEDMATMLSVLDGTTITAEQIESVEIDANDATKINVTLKRVQIATYQG